ncbi:MAG: hypothetical protein ABW364_11270 [Rhodococcus fascians]
MFGSRAPRFLPAKPTVGPKASAAALAVCATLAAACSTTSAQPHAPSPAHSAAQPPAYSTSIPTATAETVAARGTVVSSSTTTPFDPALFPAGTTAATVVYNSVSGVDGSPTQVSGAVFVPDGPAPVGGRPIVAYAHGTVGISPGCAPSEKRDLAGDADVVSRCLERGYAVAYPDYPGLSSTVDSPPHPYRDPRTAAFDVIDSVRAGCGVVHDSRRGGAGRKQCWIERRRRGTRHDGAARGDGLGRGGGDARRICGRLGGRVCGRLGG